MIDVVAVVEEAHQLQPVTDLPSYVDDCFRALAEALDRRGPPLIVRERAACKGMPIETFFPGRCQPLAEARTVCGSCPVVLECGTWSWRDPRRRLGRRGRS